MVQKTTTTTWKVQPEQWDIDNDVVEVWESMQGDLWLITETEYHRPGVAFGYARLYSMPQFAEWGSIDRKELQDNPKIWQVNRDNWGNINSYEDGLLVEVNDE